ncbi:MAG: M48 family metalloprotease [Leptolyngbyaceae cyanobacterium MO_188.B28]|nr:M48 family metalloprotease [Leptolyngbyaceae cyanobacterium MO_188.B28]
MSTESLKAGLEALKQGSYQEAVNILEVFCDRTPPDLKDVLQAQMGLVKAYWKNGQQSKAKWLCQQMTQHSNPKVQTWAKQTLQKLSTDTSDLESSGSADSGGKSQQPMGKAGRAAMAGAKLAMAGIGGNLAIASGITFSLLLGMVFVLCLGVLLILDSQNPGLGLIISIVFTLLFNGIVFFLSPFLMDLTQRWLYGTRWISLQEIKHYSPEAAQVIQKVCAERKLKQPKLGLIDDQNPTAFTYGSLPDTARLVVSRGLFTYLDDDEVATVYAHELGHIVHWDFALMTLAATLVQITYLIYTFAQRMSRGGGNNKAKDAAGSVAIAAYVFYIVGTYLMLYLSRTREYFADHFAAETTANPNGLSRSLVKIAYGIVEEGKRSDEPSRLMEGTRALGIYDAKAASSTGTAYRIAADPGKIGRVFLWDLFNPWGWWMELNSTHPLTGKRVRALSTYAEQLGLEMEFDMGRIVGEGKKLSKKRLYGNFAFDLLLYCAEGIGLVLGCLIGLFIPMQMGFIPGALIGLGGGILIKALVMYPDFNRAPRSDILTLMSDPYASPLRGQPVKLEGQLIGRGDAGYKFGSDLKLQDRSGMIFLRYASRFGPIGNFLFGMRQVKKLLGSNGGALGWFRRGVAPWMDLVQFTSSGKVINSYHRFWSFLLSGLLIVLGLFLLITAG